MSKTLFLEFANETGDTLRMSLNDPKADLDEITVKEKMDLIVGAEVFAAKGAKISTAKKAYIVDRQVTEIL